MTGPFAVPMVRQQQTEESYRGCPNAIKHTADARARKSVHLI